MSAGTHLGLSSRVTVAPFGIGLLLDWDRDAFKGPNGMPVGIQIVGPVGSDALTIAIAECIASVLL